MSDLAKPRRRHWVVCESGNRWRQSVLRWVPQWLGPHDTIAVSHVLAGEVAASTLRLQHGVVLWEIDTANELLVMRAIASLAVDRDRWLQVVALKRLATGDQLAPRDLCALSEIGVAAVIRHPEELTQLRSMVSGHFAGAHRLLH